MVLDIFLYIKYIRNILITYSGGPMPNPLKLAEIGSECVACGCCVRVCPRDAVQVLWGIRAQADPEKCIGCGKCARACPAAVIEITERRTAQ
ncbi:MAG: 4Fe-4S binding protein [Candidatus Pseudoscilispira sp.]|nr:4Fe-4S binding protein [Candidatus Pseudoscilispira sp.]